MSATISAIAAIGKDRALGRGNQLLWHIPADLRRFKELTLGHPVIMGRKTFESILVILGKPLPGRTTIVLTRDAGWGHEGVQVAHSMEDALRLAKSIDPGEVFVCGGAQIYAQALPYTDKLYLTLINNEKPADAYFPPYEHLFTRQREVGEGEHEGVHYRWMEYQK